MLMGGRFLGLENSTFTAQRTKPLANFALQDLGIPRLFLPFWNLISYLSHDCAVGSLHLRIWGFQGNHMTSSPSP